MLDLTQAVTIPYVFVGISVLLLVSVLASKASGWLGVPALLIFIVVGMLAGSDGPGGIWFDNAYVAQFLGTLALAYILFSGGLETNWASVRPVLRPAVTLATLGVLLTAVLVGLFAVFFLHFSWLEGLLLGSVMSSTDAAAVFSILRSRSVALKGRLQPLLELESGSNDPMAVFLTVAVISLLKDPSAAWWHAIPSFAWQMAFGAAMGWVFGRLTRLLVNRLGLEYEGLYPVMTIALVLLTYGATDALGGNGFLAVYLAGIIVGNDELLHRRSLIRFHGGIAWLMQIVMFLALGLLVFPSHLVPVIGSGLLVALFLMIVARPVSVFICLWRSDFSLRERLLVSWVGLRGAVPIVLATFPLMAGIGRAEMIFNLVFFVVLASVLLQGGSLPALALWFKLDKRAEHHPPPPLEFEHTAPGLRADLTEVIVAAKSGECGKRLRDLALPHGVLVTLVRRKDEYLVPDGTTVIQEGDVLLVLAARDAIAGLRARLDPDGESDDNEGDDSG